MKPNGLTKSKYPQSIFISPDASLDGFSIREILATMWRRKSIPLSTIAVLTLLTAVILQLVTPTYTGKALVKLNNREHNVVNIDSAISGLSSDAETIVSEIQVIRSRSLAQKVITELGLNHDPDFNHALSEESNGQSQKSGEATILTSLYKKAGAFFGHFMPINKINPKLLRGYSEEEYEQQMEWSRLVDYFLENLDVWQIQESYVIAVEFKAKQPVMATRITNKLVDLYIKHQLDTKSEATDQAISWLNKKVSEQQKSVEKSDTAVEVFRRDSGLLQGKEGNLIAQQISQINSQLILAEATLTESLLRFEQIGNHSGSRGSIESSSEILQSVIIQRLREQEVSLQRNIAEYSTEYGKLHPKMVNLIASLRNMQYKINREEQKIVKSLKNEVEIAESRVSSLQNSLNELKAQIAESNEEDVQLKALEREAEADHLLLNNFLSRFKEISSQEGTDIHYPDATIISRANLPVKPSFPKKIPILILSIVASGLVGLLLVFFAEHMEAGFRSGEQIEKLTGIPSLGFIPLIKGLAKHKMTSPSFFVTQPRSTFSQAINSLRWNIQLSTEHRPAKTILITSSQAQEGKTTIAVSLAKKYALAGKKALIIDADCYMPSVGNHFKMKNTRGGLIDVLLNKQVLEDVIKNDKKTGIDILLNGKPKANPTNILASKRFFRLLKTLATQYDIIILDSSPVLATSDAIILSQKVDTTLFVVRWATTNQKAVTLSLHKLIKTDSHLAGIILSMVDVEKYSQYNYGDSGSYVGLLKSYYET